MSRTGTEYPKRSNALPSSLPDGRVMVHNDAGHGERTRQGDRGFRYWLLDPAAPDAPAVTECACGWAPKLAVHYRVARETLATCTDCGVRHELYGVASDECGLARLWAVDECYSDPDDPVRLLAAQVREIIRQYVQEVGLCPTCLALFPDVLAGKADAA